MFGPVCSRDSLRRAVTVLSVLALFVLSSAGLSASDSPASGKTRSVKQMKADQMKTVTSRGLQRNSKLVWGSSKSNKTKVSKPTQVRQAAHTTAAQRPDRTRTVLVNKKPAAQQLPTINPLQEPIGDRTAQAPAYEQAPTFETEADEKPSFDPPATDSESSDGADLPLGEDGEELTAPRAGDSDASAGEEDEEPGFTTPDSGAQPLSESPDYDDDGTDRDLEKESAEECRQAVAALNQKTLALIDLDIAEHGQQGVDFPRNCVVQDREFRSREWDTTYFAWTASGLCHKPLYFEQRHLERYGHSTGPYTQPFVSAAHFFVSAAVLPYNMGIRTPNECVYALGHYRPGNCAPYLVRGVPFTWRAALFQAGAVVGTAAVLP